MLSKYWTPLNFDNPVVNPNKVMYIYKSIMAERPKKYTIPKERFSMTRKKIGRRILLAGLILLAAALVLIFHTEASPWALVVLGLSILVNTIGVCVFIWK